MKSKKFKLERDRLEEVGNVLDGMLSRAKALMTFILNRIEDNEEYFKIINIYISTILSFRREIDNLLAVDNKNYLVDKSVVDSMSEKKKFLEEIEKSFSERFNLSLKVH